MIKPINHTAIHHSLLSEALKFKPDFPYDYKLAVFHYPCRDDKLTWTHRTRDILKKRAKLKYKSEAIVYILSNDMIARVNRAIRNNEDNVTICGFRYNKATFVEYVETIDLLTLETFEY